MLGQSRSTVDKAIVAGAQAITGAAGDYDGLLALIGDAQIVLLGESTHGTHEFYAERARITRRLICEKGFCAVAVEADWPDAYRVNRYVRGTGSDSSAADALDGFRRLPSWMWCNTDVLQFVDWLRSHNDALPIERQAGFYGLDLYSMYSSIEEVLRYLDQVDPAAAHAARASYACFDHYDEDSQADGYAAATGLVDTCESGAIAQLHQLQQRAADYMQHGGTSAEDAFFHAQQNAQLVINAEQYYRTMFRGRVSSWNMRDRHMADTLDALGAYLLPGSVEALMHEALPSIFVLPLSQDSNIADGFRDKCLERAIGVFYLPATERQSHYFFTILPDQFDALLHIDRSSAVTPLETAARAGMEVAQTFPSGL